MSNKKNHKSKRNYKNRITKRTEAIGAHISKDYCNRSSGLATRWSNLYHKNYRTKPMVLVTGSIPQTNEKTKENDLYTFRVNLRYIIGYSLKNNILNITDKDLGNYAEKLMLEESKRSFIIEKFNVNDGCIFLTVHLITGKISPYFLTKLILPKLNMILLRSNPHIDPQSFKNKFYCSNEESFSIEGASSYLKN